MANSFRIDEFKKNNGLTYAVVGLLIAIAFVSLLFVLFSLIAILAPDWGIDLDDGSFMEFGFVGIGLTALVDLPLRLITIVVFLIWLYRAYGNLSPLKARNLQFSPGWAVGWWFIPFANLVKPFQVVREVYNESDPDLDFDTGFSTLAAGTPAEIGFWWAAFLLSGFLFRASDRLYGNGDRPASEYFTSIFLAGALLSIVAALLAAYIVKATNDRQNARIATISGAPKEPPPPPSFEPANLGDKLDSAPTIT